MQWNINGTLLGLKVNSALRSWRWKDKTQQLFIIRPIKTNFPTPFSWIQVWTGSESTYKQEGASKKGVNSQIQHQTDAKCANFQTRLRRASGASERRKRDTCCRFYHVLKASIRIMQRGNTKPAHTPTHTYTHSQPYHDVPLHLCGLNQTLFLHVCVRSAAPIKSFSLWTFLQLPSALLPPTLPHR